MTPIWRGTYTALVTPFRRDGAVDDDALSRLADFQMEGGVEGIVVCGTTGEGSTLTEAERLRVIESVVRRVDRRAVVLGGAGGNDTEKIAAEAREVERVGVDGILSVVPYYNKPTQAGQIEHFTRIADAVSVPILLYNVPGRTGANMKPATVRRLAEHGNVRGIKEASGDLVQMMEIVRERQEGFAVLSGEDNLTLPAIALGADGVVSVVSNEVPAMMSRMVRDALEGRIDEARELHYRLLPLMNGNFIETNPMPVKAALAMMGKIEEAFRLPMVPVLPATREELRRILAELELLEA